MLATASIVYGWKSTHTEATCKSQSSGRHPIYISCRSLTPETQSPSTCMASSADPSQKKYHSRFPGKCISAVNLINRVPDGYDLPKAESIWYRACYPLDTSFSVALSLLFLNGRTFQWFRACMTAALRACGCGENGQGQGRETTCLPSTHVTRRLCSWRLCEQAYRGQSRDAVTMFSINRLEPQPQKTMNSAKGHQKHP